MSLASSQPTHLLADVTQRACQHTVGTGLPSKGLPHNHEPVTHNHHLIDLPTGGGGRGRGRGRGGDSHNIYILYVLTCTQCHTLSASMTVHTCTLVQMDMRTYVHTYVGADYHTGRVAASHTVPAGSSPQRCLLAAGSSSGSCP